MSENLPLGILTDGELKIFKLWQKGHSEKGIASELSITSTYVYKIVKLSVDKLCNFQDNVTQYEEILKRDAMRRRRVDVDLDTVLTPTQRKVLRMWKVFGHSTGRMQKLLHISKRTLGWHKQKIKSKVDIDGIDGHTPRCDRVHRTQPSYLKLPDLENQQT